MAKTAVFTVFDKNNQKYAENLEKSFKYFHKDIDFIPYDQDKIKPWIDEKFFYRATPIIMKDLFNKGYDLVGKIDADSIVVGDLSYIFESDYEVGTVMNWNRIDPLTYGEIGLLTIAPQQYFNAGLVFTRSKSFVDEWYGLCFSPHFDAMPFREQGFLNILTHYGRHMTRCFDLKSADHDEWGFYGLVAKGEWIFARVKDGQVIIPKSEQTGFPPEDVVLKVIHFAEGNKPDKCNYKIRFNQEVIQFIDKVLR